MAAGEAQHQGTKLTVGGVDMEGRARAEMRTWEATRLVRGTTMAENLRVIGELRSTFGTLETAMEHMPAFQRMATTLGAATGRDPAGAATAAARFLDLRDAFVNQHTGEIDPQRGLAQLRMMERAIIMNQGSRMVTPE
jgi:hypothetical protein